MYLYNFALKNLHVFYEYIFYEFTLPIVLCTSQKKDEMKKKKR